MFVAAAAAVVGGIAVRQLNRIGDADFPEELTLERELELIAG